MDLWKNPEKMSERELRSEVKEWRSINQRIEAVVDRAAGDRSYDGDLIDDIRDIIDGREKITLIVPQRPHPSHKLYVSDSSLYDYKCEGCHNTDETGGGWGRLAQPCPYYPDED